MEEDKPSSGVSDPLLQSIIGVLTRQAPPKSAVVFRFTISTSLPSIPLLSTQAD